MSAYLNQSDKNLYNPGHRFSFVNLSKPDSQYSVGMKPVLYSELEAKETGTGWTRAGTEMTYFKDIKASEASWGQGEFEGVRNGFWY